MQSRKNRRGEIIMTTKKPANPYPTEPEVNKGELPDPFALPGGGRASTKDEWTTRSDEWRDMIIDFEYGGLPPAPESIKAETLCHNTIRRLPGKPCNWSYRVHCYGGEHPFSFCVRILFPVSSKPVPAIVNGDGCWWDIFRTAWSAG